MKRLVAFLPIILTTHLVLAQSKYWLRDEPAAETKIEKYNCQCVHHDTYTAAQRQMFYPFNKAVEVKLVSFPDPMSEESLKRNIERANKQHIEIEVLPVRRYPFRNASKIDMTGFIESIKLSSAQIAKLSDMLFNISERKINLNGRFKETSCYQPRNAIIFLDTNGNIFAHIDICFECRKIETTPANINWGGFCIGKLDIIKQYFASVGIKYGVTTLK